MRYLPIATAGLVSAVLYLVVFERDRLRPADTTAATELAEAEAASAPADDHTKPISVVALHSVAQNIDSAVLLRGQTEASRRVELRAETGGVIISDPARRGAFVRAGEVLCRIDPATRPAALTEAEARLPEAEARLAEAAARVKEAEINATAATKLSKGGYASETRVAGADAGLISARAALQSAKSALASAALGIDAAKRDLDRAAIAAPFDGLLEIDAAETGSLLSPGGLCATIVTLDPIKLVGFVPETDVARVSVGAAAGARLADGTEVRGRVTFLSRAADTDTRTFRVEVQVANKDLTIRDGQTAEILVAAEGVMAHLVPSSALTLDDNGQIGLRTVDGDSAGFLPVDILRDTLKGVWVGGLPEAVDIITVGQEYVIDGVPITATFREMQP